ncbi:MAG TPA: hypothetical protein DD644_06810 [Halomonas sp.]|uniref:OmpA-like domain-containing protein n=1 Tax=Halomonas campaniensis TaxID=213554 RepID=A0A3D0KJK4_9GAMM|nr:hypothetical protein [Halomonas sp.]HBS83226.1 hypothetical protein [Halomonas campaniensis]HCA03752.1 hypothetical protein [Halomonas campaniensis]
MQDYLSSQSVLGAVTVTAEGRGEAEPIADNATDKGRSVNRRVEIIGKFNSVP